MDASVAGRQTGPMRAGIAERIWVSAREEFSRHGYHGARVQGIARGASCNVALMYRHWASKRALYLDVLRAVWLSASTEIARLLEAGGGDHLDAMLRDPMGAQILIREYLDGAPFLSQLAASEPALLEPVRRAAASLSGPLVDGIDPVIAVVMMGGLAALVASSRDAARPLVGEPIPPEAWRRLVVGLLASSPGQPGGERPTAGSSGPTTR